ncbi:F-box protein At3g58530 [Linum perenne]
MGLSFMMRLLLQPRYLHLKQINLEFAQDVEDRHLEMVRDKFHGNLQNLEALNLNVCQMISDKGIEKYEVPMFLSQE